MDELNKLTFGGRRYRHGNRGTEYEVVAEGHMQAADWRVFDPVAERDVRIDMTPVVVYRSLTDGSVWVRPREEFYDGRFEAMG